MQSTKTSFKILSVALALLIVVQILPVTVIAEDFNERQAVMNVELSTQSEEKSPIVSEVVSERDAFKKVFEREDGSFTAIISSGPVHYFDDGKWLEIDNTLTEKNGAITNESNSLSVDLPSQLTPNKEITISTENAELAFSMNDISSAAAVISDTPVVTDENSLMLRLGNIDSAVEYSSVMANTDLVYDIGADSVKESIILSSSPSETAEYSYTINSNGASLYLNEDKSINVVKNGQIEFVIESPFMFDSNGAYSSEISVTLDENTANSEYSLTYTPNYAWLSSSERTYPVTIDPTTTVYSANAILETIIGVTDSTVMDENSYTLQTERLYYKYSDATSEKFGQNSVITNAEFSLYCEALTDDDTYGVYPINAAWDEETTTAVSEGTLLIDYNTIKYGEPAKRYVWDITKLASKWQMNQEENNGFVLRRFSDSTSNTKIYRSSTANYTTHRPWFQIDYVTIDNMDASDTEIVDMGRAGTLYLNKYTGTYYVNRTDLSLNGNVSPVTMSFTYDPWSESTSLASSYGAYWITDYYNKIFYSQTVIENNATRHQYTFRDNAGIKTRFLEVVSSDEDYSEVPEGFTESYLEDYTRFEAVSGDTSKCLWVPKSDTTYKDFANMIIEDSEYRYVIDSINRVTSRVHKTSGEVIAIAHRTATSDGIRSITDGVGRKYDLPTFTDINGKTLVDKLDVYNSSGTQIKVTTLTGDVAVGVDYGYQPISSTTAYLTSVTYADDEVIIYEYNSDGLMTAITNVDNSRLELSYSGDRVISYTKYAYYNTEESTENCFESRLDISFDGAKQRTFTYYEYDDTTPKLVTKQRYDLTLQTTDYIDTDGNYSYMQTMAEGENETVSYSANDNDATNLLVNGDFSNGDSGWTFIPSANGGTGNLSSVYTFEQVMGKFGFLRSGLNKTLRAYQTVSNLSANDETVYTLSAWAYGLRTSTGPYVGDYAHIDKTFAMCVMDNESNILAQYNFDATLDDWQFGAISFKTDTALEDVKVIFMADYQIYLVKFDDVRLVESETGFVQMSEDDTMLETMGIPETVVAEDGNTYRTEPCDSCSCAQCSSPIEVGENTYYYNCDCDSDNENIECDCFGCRQDRSTTTQNDENYDLVLSQTVSNGEKSYSTNYTYTSNNNYLASVTDSDGISVYYNYNMDTGYLASISYDNNQSVIMQYTYNGVGALEQVTQTVNGLSNGSLMSAKYTYAGDRITTMSHNGTVYFFEYDHYGNVTNIKVGGSETTENKQSIVSYGYDGKQRNNSITYGNGTTISYTYTDDKITQILYSTGQKYVYTYDSEDNLTSLYDYASSIATFYTDGSLSSIKCFTVENNEAVLGETVYSVTVSDEGTKTETVFSQTITTPEPTQKYVASTDSVETYSTVAFGDSTLDVSYTEDFFGRNTEKTITREAEGDEPKSYTAEYTYNDTATTASSQIAELENYIDNELYSSFAYTYDNMGNIISVTKSGVLNNEYVYDEANQLKEEYNYSLGTATIYVYDTNGNIVSKTPYTNVTSKDLSSATVGETIVYTYSDPNWSDKLTSYNGQSITYDASGNPTSYKGATITWDGRLMSSYSKDEMRYEYEYNADGLRTVKRIYDNDILTGTGLYVWENDVLLAYKLTSVENNSSMFIRYIYDSLGELCGAEIDGDFFAYVKNLQNDVTVIVPLKPDSDLNINIEYDAWGNPTYSQADSFSEALFMAIIFSLNNVSYRGYFYDMETGLYYLQSRYYDPETGRFINSDDTGYLAYDTTSSSLNLFIYCVNNPLNYIDFSGYWGLQIHETITTNAYSEHVCKHYLDVIISGNFDMDNSYPAFPHGDAFWFRWYKYQKYHFDRHKFEGIDEDTRIYYAKQFVEKAKNYWIDAMKAENKALEQTQVGEINHYKNQAKTYYKKAMDNLGRATHCIQDYSAHGNIGNNLKYIPAIHFDRRVDKIGYDWANKERTKVKVSTACLRYYESIDCTRVVLLLFYFELELNYDSSKLMCIECRGLQRQRV